MRFFKQLHKSAFWSQLLLGIVAILALPIPQLSNETENSPIQQTLTLSELVAKAQSQSDETQIYFFLQDLFSLQVVIKQAVTFCQLFTSYYHFDTLVNPPIRAGPVI
ncbi:hypothetical protein A6B43_06810 [Vespertiliibacter pulmonis]|uniref:Uncharacterized protein DUF2547 n=1 Tax=Vespertiliibacter pulmonis TaxID=1443036 RepID=A0A3N4W398_9PAST|nr:secA translation cis-regulator SecM [Vespertiliibacter pulmonis]QLB21247.1 hypothetical protein A6B43_06810 [Vespertiliibacter pulmonis]RPE85651.1 uncharacterized protein DUF2547 [Vespertiliibacter pulmonis]